MDTRLADFHCDWCGHPVLLHPGVGGPMEACLPCLMLQSIEQQHGSHGQRPSP